MRHFVAGNIHLSSEFFECLTVDDTLSKEDQKIIEELQLQYAAHGNLPFEWTPQENAYVSNHDKSQWRDYVIYRYKMKVYPRDKIIAEFPTYLLVEPVSACNLRCVMCFQIDKTFTKKPFMGTMDFEMFKRVIDEAHNGGTRAVTMASRGEPTLHPHITDMLHYASGKFVDLKMNTNGTKLTEDMTHRILSSGLTELVFSIEAQDAELYSKIRVGGKFNEVVRNIERVRDIRAKHYPDSKLTTTVSGVFFKQEQNVELYTNFWKTRVDHIATVECENRWNTYENVPHPDMTHPCEYLWERAYIWWNGDMNPCDVDYKSKLLLGNISSSTIAEIWHGELFSKMRDAHLNNQRAKFMPCDRCGI